MNTIGRNIKQLREQCGMSQNDLANLSVIPFFDRFHELGFYVEKMAICRRFTNRKSGKTVHQECNLKCPFPRIKKAPALRGGQLLQILQLVVNQHRRDHDDEHESAGQNHAHLPPPTQSSTILRPSPLFTMVKLPSRFSIRNHS